MSYSDFSEEYKRNIEAWNQFAKKLTLKFDEIQRMNLKISKAWYVNCDTEILKSISTLKEQMASLSAFSEQLKEAFAYRSG